MTPIDQIAAEAKTRIAQVGAAADLYLQERQESERLRERCSVLLSHLVNAPQITLSAIDAYEAAAERLQILVGQLAIKTEALNKLKSMGLLRS